MSIFSKQISSSTSINIISTQINYAYKVETAYFVEWVKTKFFQNKITKKNYSTVEKIRDNFAFSRKEDAKIYAQCVEGPSKFAYINWNENDNTNPLSGNWYKTARIFPKGFHAIYNKLNNEELVESFQDLVLLIDKGNGAEFFYDSDFITKFIIGKEVKQIFINGRKLHNEITNNEITKNINSISKIKDELLANRKIDELLNVYKEPQIKKIIDSWFCDTNFDNVEETYLMTPLGISECSTVCGKLQNNLNELVDSELKRIEEYKNNLQKLKK